MDNMLDNAFITEAKEKICSAFNLKDKLKYLGHGQEGIVFCNSFYVYKYFYRANLEGVSEDLFKHLTGILQIMERRACSEMFKILFDGGNLFVYYPNKNSSMFRPLPRQAYISLIRDYRSRGIVYSNVRTKNLCVTKSDELFFCDIGKAILPWNHDEFLVMVLALFTIYMLQKNNSFLDNENTFLTRKNLCIDNLIDFLGDLTVKTEYENFLAAI